MTHRQRGRLPQTWCRLGTPRLAGGALSLPTVLCHGQECQIFGWPPRERRSCALWCSDHPGWDRSIAFEGSTGETLLRRHSSPAPPPVCPGTEPPACCSTVSAWPSLGTGSCPPPPLQPAAAHSCWTKSVCQPSQSSRAYLIAMHEHGC